VNLPATSARFAEALAFTAEVFKDKTRKGSGVPYVVHLLYVTSLVGEAGGTEDQLIAALLHDYLEDIPSGTVEELRSKFGERVTRYVLALSDTVVQPKPPWKERKLGYLQHLIGEEADVKLISVSDKLHNCTSIVRDYRLIGEEIFDRFNAKRVGTFWYYRSVYSALANNWSHWLLDELHTMIVELHRISGEPLPEGWETQLDWSAKGVTGS
jgi:(p)ppGpp synthase/HD superfamily hydrolase